MKPEQTVLRPVAGHSNLDPRSPTYYVPDLHEHRARAGLLPLPPLAKALMAVGAVLCVVFAAFVWSLLA